MSFKKFWQRISDLLPDRLVLSDPSALSRLDPDKIYPENVRAILGVSAAHAIRICETAVRQGLFRRRVEVVCPDGSVAASAAVERDLPETVRCWSEEGGEYHESEVATRELKKVTFYQLLHNDTSNTSHAATA